MSARAWALVCGLLGVLAARSAAAEPTIWARARDPGLARRAHALALSESLLLQAARAGRGEDVATPELRAALRVLDDVGASRSRDRELRHRYASVLYRLGDCSAAVPHFEAVLRLDPPPPVEADVAFELGVCYAKLGRHEDEIAVYSRALALTPVGRTRSLVLANQAEAFMVTGDLSSAVAGYREALGSMSQLDLAQAGVTTLWGLAVATDRSGDLEEALATIRLARSYDPTDRRLRDGGWFYVPPYDEHWYAALGHWAAARTTDLGSVRMETYARAVASWGEYLAAAPPQDRWIPIAKARLAQCEQEREANQRRWRPGARKPGADRSRGGQ